MADILKKAKIPIIIVVVLIIGFIVYNTILKKEDDSGGLDHTSGSEFATEPSLDFEPLLNLIKSVDFDDTFFADPVFKSMVDFSQPVQEEQKGRDNPFSPGIVSSSANLAATGVIFEASENNSSTTPTTSASTTPAATTTPR